LATYPVANSQYYKIAKSYFTDLEPFALSKRYALPVTVLFLVTLSCASVTYFGTQWTDYLGTANYVLGGTYVLKHNAPEEVLAYQTSTVAIGSAAFIGAYVYIVQVILNRINNDDISPITYYYFAVRILVACLVAGIVRHGTSIFGPADSDTFLLTLIPIGFVIGLQPDLWISALTTKISKKFGLLGRQKDPEDQDIPGNLSLLLIEGLTDGKRARLEELDLDNCQALSEHNPFIIWARTSYQLLHIVDWMSQAQLILLVKDAGIKKLRAHGIRDIFAFETSLSGKGKQQLANILAISPEVADDLLRYLTNCPSFLRLKDVYGTL
jgi:hypothetical protein